MGYTPYLITSKFIVRFGGLENMLNTHKVSCGWTLFLVGLCIEKSYSDMQNANLIQVFSEPTLKPVQSSTINP